MKQNYILLSVSLPTGDSHAEEQAQLAFDSAARQIEDQPMKGERLSRNVWLLDRDCDSAVLAHVIFSCNRQDLKYSVRFLSSD
jgi:hypothetical protein